MSDFQKCASCGLEIYFVPVSVYLAKVMTLCKKCFETKDIYMRNRKVSKLEKRRRRASTV